LYCLISKSVAKAEIVNKLASKFGLLTILGDSLETRSYRLRILFLLLLLGLASSRAVAGADVQNVLDTSGGFGSQFAIADFDGDLRPDLANIQAAPDSSNTTTYWIQLQLSAVGRQSFRIVAPAGGLRIEARDVNGDRAVDLVLITAWFGQPVAIFLNDGHGSFSRVESAAFPGAFSESKANWASASSQARDSVGVPPQSQSSLCSEVTGLLQRKLRAGSILLPREGFLVNPFLISHPGRAPPSEDPRF
jgi:hypothetical protein